MHAASSLTAASCPRSSLQTGHLAAGTSLPHSPLPSLYPAITSTLTWMPPALPALLQREGVRGLYSGILPEYYKVVPGVAIAFCTYELMKKMLGVQTNATQR